MNGAETHMITNTLEGPHNVSHLLKIDTVIGFKCNNKLSYHSILNFHA